MCTKSEGFGYRELNLSYYTIKPCAITSCVTYLLSRTKPAGSLISRSRYTLSRTRIQNRGVVKNIKTNT